MNKKWLTLAVLFGGCAPGIAVSLFAIVWLLIKPEPEASILLAVLGSFFGITVFAFPVLLFFGLPIFLLFRELGIANIYTCIIAAVSPAIVVGFIPSFASTFEQQAVFGFLFLVSAIAFWYFAKNTVKLPKN